MSIKTPSPPMSDVLTSAIADLFDENGHRKSPITADFIKGCLNDLCRHGIVEPTCEEFMDFIYDNFPDYAELTETELLHLVRLGIIGVVRKDGEFCLVL